ncbi:MAG: VCBS domain-containing protein, partial [Pirellulales bacterium]
PEQNELLDPIFDFAPSWSPLGFSATIRSDVDPLSGVTNIDIDPVREGNQWRFSLDISRTNESTDSFVAFVKWIDQATIDRYADASLELRDLDGAVISDVGWYDFTQRVPGGDGVAIGSNGGTVLYLDYIITDNSFGDSNPAVGVIDDPGIPIFINYLNDNRPLVVSSPTVNEQSPFAELSVAGAAKQLVELQLVNGTATDGGTDFGAASGTGLEYSADGGVTWTAYTGGLVELPTTGTILVRTPLVQDGIPDDGETFQLSAQTTGGATFTGTATIIDDGAAEDDRTTVYEQGGSLNPMPWRAAMGNVLANDDNTRGGTVTGIRTGGLEGQGTAGTVGSSLQGQYGVLSIRSHGAFTYSLDNNNPLVDQLPEGGRLVEQFNYTMTNGEWSDIAVIVIDIVGANDSPVLAFEQISLGDVPVNTGVTESPEGPVGVVVSTVLSTVGAQANVSDVDLGTSIGFAITGIDQTNGSWWFSEDNGNTWARMAPVSEASPRLLTSTARVYFRPDRNVTGEIPHGFTFRAWDQSRGLAGQTAPIGSLGDSLSVIHAAAALNVAMPAATVLEFGTSTPTPGLRQTAPVGDVAVRNEHVSPAVITSVTPEARVVTLGTGPVEIVSPQGDVTIGRGGTGVLIVRDVPVGSLVRFETSFGVV